MKHKKSINKRRANTLSAAIALMVFMVVIIVTLAMFTSTDMVTNRFNGANLDILLTESKWDPSKAKNIVPETVLDKNPTVTNIDEVDAYVFLKVTVPYATVYLEDYSGTNKGQKLSGSPMSIPLYKFGQRKSTFNTDGSVTYAAENEDSQLINSGWVQVGGYQANATANTRTYVYAHVNSLNQLIPLMKGTTTQYPLFDKIKLVNFNEETGGSVSLPADYSIRVEAYGIQANYSVNGTTSTVPLDVWHVIDSTWPPTS